MNGFISPGGKRIRNGIPRVRVWYRLPTELVEWLNAEAEARQVADTVLLTRALEDLRRTLPPLPARGGSSGTELLEEATAALDARR